MTNMVCRLCKGQVPADYQGALCPLCQKETVFDLAVQGVEDLRLLISDAANVSIIPYHEELLNVSRRLIDEAQDEKYQLAVVMAQAACEVFTEQIISALIDSVEPESLRTWIHQRATRPNDLSDDRVRQLYLGLTGCKIDTGQGLWQDYMTHTKRRHQVVHRGEKVSKDQATHSYDTARKVIEYLRAAHIRSG